MAGTMVLMLRLEVGREEAALAFCEVAIEGTSSEAARLTGATGSEDEDELVEWEGAVGYR
jgi:hypothetical protein